MNKPKKIILILCFCIALLYWTVGLVSAQAINPPSQLGGTGATDSSLGLHWFDNANNESNFRLERSSDDGTSWTILADLEADTESYIDTSFVCDTPYRYRVSAYIAAENLFSEPANFNLSSAVPCAVSNLQVLSSSQFSITLTWTDNSTVEDWYYIEHNAHDIFGWTPVGMVPANTTSFLDTNVYCGQENIEYRVRAVGALDIPNYSETILASTSPCEGNLITEASCEFTQFNTGIETDFAVPGPLYLSGNGSRLAFNYHNSNGISEDFLVYDVATETQIFAFNPALWGDIDYSGNRFVFLSNQDFAGQNSDGGWEVFYWDNGNISAITDADASNSSDFGAPQISDDGSIIVFSGIGAVLGDPSSGRFIYIWDAVNGVRKLVDEARLGDTDTPAVDVIISGDGSTVAFFHDASLSGLAGLGESQIYLWDSVNGVRLMYPFSHDVSTNLYAFHINTDGSRIAFTDNGNPLNLNANEDDEIFIWDASTGLSQLTEWNDLWGNASLSISMDGSGNRLFFISLLLLDYDQTNSTQGGYYFFDEGYGFSQLSFDIDAVWPPIGSVLSDDGLTVASLEIVGWDGQGDPTPYTEIFIGDCTPADYLTPPSMLETTAVYPDSFDMSWVDNALSETAYKIERSYDGIDWTEVVEVPADSTSYTDSGLICNITYFYRVRAYRATDSHYSDYSNTDAKYINCLAMPAPSNLAVTGTTESSVSLAWEDNVLSETAYRLERSTDGATWTELVQLPSDSISYTDNAISCGTSYSYRVRAYRVHDNQYSEYSNIAEWTSCHRASLSHYKHSYSLRQDLSS